MHACAGSAHPSQLPMGFWSQPDRSLQESQDVKVPQLRGMYQKTGLRQTAGEQLTDVADDYATLGYAHLAEIARGRHSSGLG